MVAAKEGAGKLDIKTGVYRTVILKGKTEYGCFEKWDKNVDEIRKLLW